MLLEPRATLWSLELCQSEEAQWLWWLKIPVANAAAVIVVLVSTVIATNWMTGFQLPTVTLSWIQVLFSVCVFSVKKPHACDYSILHGCREMVQPAT